MRKRHVSALVTLWLMGAVLVPPGALADPPEGSKTEICHYADDAEPDAPMWILLEISTNAVDKHEAHLDGFPGEAVPGTGGAYEFDDFCTPVLVDFDADGIRDDEDNCPAIANADQSDRYGSPKGDACEDDSNGDGILDINEDRMCVSIDGVLLIQKSDAVSCSSTAPSTAGGRSNIAVAHGFDSHAIAVNGSGNTATADGDFVLARAENGDNNAATLNGVFIFGTAGNGDNNTLIIDAADSSGSAENGDNNTAIVLEGPYSGAGAGDGDGNTAIAEGAFAGASARDGDGNTATATGSGSQATARNGNDNAASATGTGSQALAQNGNNNTATAVGELSFASAQAPDGCTAEAFGDNAIATCP